MDLYNNDLYMGSGMIYIEQMTSETYKYTADGATIEVLFRPNGSMSKTIISGGGQSMSTTYFYNGSDDVFPYKIVLDALSKTTELRQFIEGVSIKLEETEVSSNKLKLSFSL